MENKVPHSPPNQDCHKMANSHCHECVLRGDKEVNADATRWKRLRQSLLCPPGVKLGRACTFLLVFPLVWIAGYGLTGHEMLLDGNLFKIYIIFFACLLGGWLMEIIRLPGLLGMIIVGMIFGNLKHQISWMEHPIQHGWSGKIRGVALVVILIRAGLGLNPEQLRRLSLMVARLAFVPSTVEAIIVACVSNLILGLRWAWAFTLGFALAAVSPAIVVPYMLKIQENGYGVDKGIPTLLLAASSLNDVFSIWAFLVFLGITFSQRSFVMQTIMPFVEVLLGFLYGIVIGIILWFIPNRKDNFALAEIRSILLLIGGIASYFGSISIKMHSAGALGALTLAFVASYGWRRQGYKQDNPVSLNFNFLWFIFQPLLFGLVGAELDFLKIKLTTVRYGLIVIFIGLLFRCCGAFVVLSGGNLNVKEKLFVAFSWLPKATVQAAVGSNALDAALALTDPNPQHIEWGQDILTIAVMAILVSAPIGATFIRCCTSRLLEKTHGMQTVNSICQIVDEVSPTSGRSPPTAPSMRQIHPSPSPNESVSNFSNTKL